MKEQILEQQHSEYVESGQAEHDLNEQHKQYEELELSKFGETISKDKIQSDIDLFQSALDSGDVKALDLVVFAKYLAEMAKGINDIAEDQAIDEFADYGERSVKYKGVKFETREVGVRYDFSKTAKWVEVKQGEKDYSDARKALEAQLKTFTKPGILSVDDEVIDVCPPIRSSKTGLVKTLK